MKDAVSIQSFIDADEPHVVALWQLVFPGNVSGHNDPRTSIRRKLALQRELFFVGRIGETIVGTTMAGYDGHRGWIYSVAVHPDHRRRGIGRALLAHAEKALKALDCPKINLQVLVANADVVAFYQSCGYVVEERISMGKKI